MEIPYTTEIRPDTGLTNPKLGIWLSLASEVMLFVLSWAAFEEWPAGGIPFVMGLTLLGGALFLAVKAAPTFLGSIHVDGPARRARHCRMVVNLFLWGPGVRMWHTDQARFINRVEVAGIYWRFVDLIWIFIFPVLYLL